MGTNEIQNKHEIPSVSAAIINFNGCDTILQTVQSLLCSEGVKVDIQIIDDCSTDNSLELVRNEYPDIPIFSRDTNSANLNARRNEGLERSINEIVLITDNDINFDKECIRRLFDVMDTDTDVIACIPRLMYWGNSTKVYSGGGVIHYAGAQVSGKRGTIRTGEIVIAPEPTAGGGIGLYRKPEFEELGAFDDFLKMAPWDDGEAHQRIRLSGKKVLYVDAAYAEHMAKEFDETRHRRAEGILFNRWTYILTQYDLRTLLLLTPALTVFELVQIAFYTMKKIPNLYFRGTKNVWSARKAILEKRKRVLANKCVSDKDLITSGEIVLAEQTSKNNKFILYSVKLLSWFYSAYWIIIKPFLRA